MKRSVDKWSWLRRGMRMLVLRLDRPRRMNRLIDYFGERLATAMAPDRRPRTQVAPFSDAARRECHG
jgi:hypothetical protein